MSKYPANGWVTIQRHQSRKDGRFYHLQRRACQGVGRANVDWLPGINYTVFEIDAVTIIWHRDIGQKSVARPARLIIYLLN